MERVVLSCQAMSRARRWTLKVQACNEMPRSGSDGGLTASTREPRDTPSPGMWGRAGEQGFSGFALARQAGGLAGLQSGRRVPISGFARNHVLAAADALG